MKKAITDKRVALQLTQKELGDKIGVSQGAIAQWKTELLSQLRTSCQRWQRFYIAP